VTEFAPCQINGKWWLNLPRHRVEFHEARPLWEAGRLASCSERIRPGMTVYDIGAEHGDFTALYRQWVTDRGRVIPFEPSPPYWPCIRETFEANEYAPPAAWFAGFASACTDLSPITEHTATIDGTPRDGWPACAYEANSDVDIGRFRHLIQEGRTTPQIRVDEFAAKTGLRPDVVVIDVEGAEHDVLEGMTELLADPLPLLVYVSVHDIGEWNSLSGWYNHTAADLDEHMDKFRFGREELAYNGEGERFFLYERRQ
jgi:FkbM family methyltransferase